MHTEHLQNVEPGWVFFGWFIGAAVFSLLLMGMMVTGLVDEETATSAWMLIAVFLGYVGGGFVIGMRTGAAPILHAVGVGLFSLVFWLAANLLASGLGAATWRSTAPEWVVGGILLQMIATGTGHHLASREARAESRPLTDGGPGTVDGGQ
jgi:hypothetical protein